MSQSLSAQSNSYSLLTTLCQTRGILSALIVAQVLALIISLSEYQPDNFWLVLGQSSLLIQFITSISIAALYILSRVKPDLNNSVQALAVVAALVLSTLAITLYISYLELLGAQLSHWFVFKSSAISLLVAALFVQFMAIYNEHAKAHSAYARAQLDALQARIRPHFLFNSLNTLAELAHEDSDAAEESALALASLSRAAMQVGQQSTLAQEIALAKRYIALEQWRFGERLKVNWHLPGSMPEVVLPCLTLQPLLENAVVHGIESSDKGGVIDVEVHITKQSATVIVSNSLSAQSTPTTRAHNGIALDNIQKRLSIIYAGQASMRARRLADSYRVKLVVPTVESIQCKF
ncbi:sensor histidine kinase [Pseudoalteromonas sp. T1lg48]|uniref:sensor histidine kinase n=1 Tax=Pseudoalteromonas sp. T1lg48 TaxID=2077100 RepID=UPI001F21910E|nr:histidine kinase [Pseudoalteromonas sp. T1lg48]